MRALKVIFLESLAIRKMGQIRIHDLYNSSRSPSESLDDVLKPREELEYRSWTLNPFLTSCKVCEHSDTDELNLGIVGGLLKRDCMSSSGHDVRAFFTVRTL